MFTPVSGLVSGPRPYQQETAIRCSSWGRQDLPDEPAAQPALPSEDTTNARITKSIAAIAAVVTTISLFAAVASLADNDRAQAYAAKSVPSALAANTR